MPITSSDLLLALGVTSLSFPRVTELPSSPDIGEVCFLQGADKAYIFTGAAWEILGNPPNSSSGGSTTVINNTIDLPSQTGKSGKYLTTDGASASWADTPVELPSQTGNAGKMLITDGISPTWAEVPSSGVNTPELPPQAQNTDKILSTDGTAPLWITAPTGLPSQSGNTGKILATDGSIASWIAPPTELPSQIGNANKMLVTNGSAPAWMDVPTEIPTQTGNSGKVLSTNGTTTTWIAPPVRPSIYDIAYSNPEQIPAASTLLYFAFPRPVTVPNTFEGSFASAMGVFADTAISIRKNGVEVGVVFFSSDTGSAMFSGTAQSAITFAVGDILSFESPGDTNLLGVSIAVSGVTT